MRPRTLTVHLDDVPVATFTGTRPGRVSCAYLGAAFEMAGLTAPLLSCSLPLRRGRGAAYPFASGLLPEGVHRQVMAGIAGVPTHDVIGMLARFGRDVAGALVITEGDLEHRPQPSVEPYDEHGLDRAVAELSDHPLGLYDDSELSIAGLADKMLLARTPDGGFGRPRHGAASTHILKVDDRTRRGLVRAEHACLALARDVDLAAAHSTVL
ncbi:MAG: HipA N-terminal domain-containing protein, partial [Ornithinibacter sp.]